jgi:hypothetical protein
MAGHYAPDLMNDKGRYHSLKQGLSEPELEIRLGWWQISTKICASDLSRHRHFPKVMQEHQWLRRLSPLKLENGRGTTDRVLQGKRVLRHCHDEVQVRPE